MAEDGTNTPRLTSYSGLWKLLFEKWKESKAVRYRSKSKEMYESMLRRRAVEGASSPLEGPRSGKIVQVLRKAR